MGSVSLSAEIVQDTSDARQDGGHHEVVCDPPSLANSLLEAERDIPADDHDQGSAVSAGPIVQDVSAAGAEDVNEAADNLSPSNVFGEAPEGEATDDLLEGLACADAEIVPEACGQNQDTGVGGACIAHAEITSCAPISDEDEAMQEDEELGNSMGSVSLSAEIVQDTSDARQDGGHHEVVCDPPSLANSLLEAERDIPADDHDQGSAVSAGPIVQDVSAAGAEDVNEAADNLSPSNVFGEAPEGEATDDLLEGLACADAEIVPEACGQNQDTGVGGACIAHAEISSCAPISDEAMRGERTEATKEQGGGDAAEGWTPSGGVEVDWHTCELDPDSAHGHCSKMGDSSETHNCGSPLASVDHETTAMQACCELSDVCQAALTDDAIASSADVEVLGPADPEIDSSPMMPSATGSDICSLSEDCIEAVLETAMQGHDLGVTEQGVHGMEDQNDAEEANQIEPVLDLSEASTGQKTRGNEFELPHAEVRPSTHAVDAVDAAMGPIGLTPSSTSDARQMVETPEPVLTYSSEGTASEAGELQSGEEHDAELASTLEDVDAAQRSDGADGAAQEKDAEISMPAAVCLHDLTDNVATGNGLVTTESSASVVQAEVAEALTEGLLEDGNNIGQGDSGDISADVSHVYALPGPVSPRAMEARAHEVEMLPAVVEPEPSGAQQRDAQAVQGGGSAVPSADGAEAAAMLLSDTDVTTTCAAGSRCSPMQDFGDDATTALESGTPMATSEEVVATDKRMTQVMSLVHNRAALPHAMRLVSTGAAGALCTLLVAAELAWRLGPEPMLLA